MKKKIFLSCIVSLTTVVFAQQPKSNNLVLQKNGITLTEVEESTQFSKATLRVKNPVNKAKIADGKVRFSYTVENYQLGNQTPDADAKHCANSAKGQHIHLILNNAPYSAYYTPEFEQTLQDGHYVALSFLSRSYHESIKIKSAYTLTQFSVGASTENDVDLTKPMLFYSRPKGTYTGVKEIKKLLLDFYLVNTTLSEKGNSVRATINGTEFILTKWAPYIIEGLPMGKNKIKLELLDKSGKLIEGKFNDSGERTFELLVDEPAMK